MVIPTEWNEGYLQIRYDSDPIELLDLGVLNLGMHRIINRVAYQLLEGRLPEEYREQFESRSLFNWVDPLLVRTRVEIQEGSIIQTIQTVLPEVILEIAIERGICLLATLPHVVGYALAAANWGRHARKEVVHQAHFDVPIADVGTNVRSMAYRIARMGKPTHIEFRSLTPQGGFTELIVDIDGDRD